MTDLAYINWSASLHTSLDLDYLTTKVALSKAKLLETGLKKGGSYLLTLSSGFELEIVKVVSVSNGILTLERAQQGTLVHVWPAGTVLEARIKAQVLEDLNIDQKSLMNYYSEVLLAPNGDLITKRI